MKAAVCIGLIYAIVVFGIWVAAFHNLTYALLAAAVAFTLELIAAYPR